MKHGLTGGERLRKVLADIREKTRGGDFVRVGFLEGATYTNGTPVAYVAAIAEWGNPANGQPPRPFFRQMIDGNQGSWGGKMARFMKATKCDATLSLSYMGETIKSELQGSIRKFSGAPLSPVTLLLRQRFPMRDDMQFSDVLQARHDIAAGVEPGAGHAKPLIWTGHMMNSVDYQVRAGG